MAEHKTPTPTHAPTLAPAATPAPAPARPEQKVVKTKQLETYQDKKIVARRPSRQGDDGYQLSTLDDQVTIILEDGSEKVVKSSDLIVEA